MRFPVFIAGTIIIAHAIIIDTTPAFACEGKRKTSLSNTVDKVSYTIGVDMGKNFDRQNVKVNPELVMQGLNDVIQQRKLVMTDEQMQQTLASFQKDLIAKHAEEFKQLSNNNKKAGKAFLASNKKQKGVVALDNGLQYKVISAGKGKKPSQKDTVTVDYEGKLISGEIFDSSYDRGTPATFKLSEVIPGWTQALQLMSVGSTWEIYVPSELAYGEKGVGDPIGPNVTLIFKVNLLSIGDNKQG